MNKKLWVGAGVVAFVFAANLVVAETTPGNAVPFQALWDAVANLEGQIAAAVANLQAQIADIQLAPGPQGPQGEPGPQGLPGKPGANLVVKDANGNFIGYLLGENPLDYVIGSETITRPIGSSRFILDVLVPSSNKIFSIEYRTGKISRDRKIWQGTIIYKEQDCQGEPFAMTPAGEDDSLFPIFLNDNDGTAIKLLGSRGNITEFESLKFSWNGACLNQHVSRIFYWRLPAI